MQCIVASVVYGVWTVCGMYVCYVVCWILCAVVCYVVYAIVCTRSSGGSVPFLLALRFIGYSDITIILFYLRETQDF